MRKSAQSILVITTVQFLYYFNDKKNLSPTYTLRYTSRYVLKNLENVKRDGRRQRTVILLSTRHSKAP